MQKRITYHEAAHAVVGVLVGLPFDEVSVDTYLKPLGDGYYAKNYKGILYDPERKAKLNADIQRRKLPRAEAMSILAGPMAEQMVVGKIDEELEQGAYWDHFAIREGCKLDNLPDLVAATAKLLEENWQAIEKVGLLLNQNKTVKYAEVSKTTFSLKSTQSDFHELLLGNPKRFDLQKVKIFYERVFGWFRVGMGLRRADPSPDLWSHTYKHPIRSL